MMPLLVSRYMEPVSQGRPLGRSTGLGLESPCLLLVRAAFHVRQGGHKSALILCFESIFKEMQKLSVL